MFLVNLMKERNDVRLLLEPVQMKQAEYNTFDYRTLDTKQLFFHSGYFTIKDATQSSFNEELVYTLGIPNEEVWHSLWIILPAVSLSIRLIKQFQRGTV
jgi:hypothetical protein